MFDGTRKLGEAIADALGKWKLELPGLAPGAYSLTLKQTSPEGEGNYAAGAGGRDRWRRADPRGGVAGRRPDGDGGRAGDDQRCCRSGTRVAIYAGLQKLGEAVANALGQWTLELPALAPGVYDLTLRQTTPDGQETTASQPAIVLEVVPKPEGEQPAVTQPEGVKPDRDAAARSA